ncbi:SET and MYND domain-containing protein 4 [Armadillidium vulgare]|nr:SET and MYND domain-containing protein 4 [Armadillidium vulgare]
MTQSNKQLMALTVKTNMSDSNFSCQPLLDKLTHVLIKSNCIKDFTPLDSVEKKLCFCLSKEDIKYDEETFINIRKEINNLIDVLYPLSTKHRKCLKKAEHFKAKGSKSFVKKKDEEALKLYTEGLKHAPYSSSIIPILYGNRSAVHFENNNFEECLIDIERALKKGYPSELLSKLYKRKIETLFKLGREKESFEVLQSKKELLSTSDEGLTTLMVVTSVQIVTFLRALLYLRKNHLPSILLPEYFATHCQNCFALLKNPIPCDYCCDVFWCGEKCLEEGSEFHRYECSYLHILTSVGIAHLSLRVLLIAGWSTCQAVRNEKEEEENVTRLFLSKDKKSHYKSVYNLISHFDKAVPEDQFQYCLAAIILAKVLTEKTNFLSPEDADEKEIPPKVDQEIFVTIASLLVHHISQLVSNAHAITQLEASTSDSTSVSLNQTKQNRIATAIYPLASLMNHSCLPSIINSFNGSTLIIHSIEDIKKEDQIFNCYGPHACRQQRKERQAALQQQYFFQCCCKACTDEKLLIKEKSWNGITCPSCGKVSEIIEEENGSPFSKETIISCETCGTLPQKILNQYFESVELHEEGEECLKNGKLSEAEKILTMALNVGKEIYVQNNNFLNIIRDDLAKCYVIQGKYINALELLDVCIKTIEFRYGEESVEVGHELVKYLDVLQYLNPCQTEKRRDIEDTKTRIEAIFTTNYGKYWKNYLKIYI